MSNITLLTTHPLQSWEWGEFRKSQGVKVVRFSAYQISFHRLPFLNFTVGYLPKSPFPNKRDLEKLKEIGKKNNAIFIKIEPNVEKSLSPNPYYLPPRNSGLRPAPVLLSPL